MDTVTDDGAYLLSSILGLVGTSIAVGSNWQTRRLPPDSNQRNLCTIALQGPGPEIQWLLG